MKKLILLLIVFMLAFTSITFAKDKLVTTMSGRNYYYVESLRDYMVQLPSLFVDGAGPILTSTAPDCSTVDNVAAVVYASSAEVAEIQFMHPVSLDFGGLKIEVTATSSVATGSLQALDWSIFVQDPDSTIGTVVAQTGAAFTSTSMDTENDKVTLTLNAAGIAAVTRGTSVIDIAIWNDGTGNGTLEIKGIKVLEQ